MSNSDLKIILEDLFAKCTDYGKLPTNQAQILNKFDDEELATVLVQLLYAYNMIVDASEEYV